ncbi:hypothetical protein HZZ07_23135 [Serratia marcescens]|nr:hypothetical protein HZZ07_23135 [Serratia marcescens]
MSKKAPQRTFACPSSPLYRPDRFTNLVARHINYHNMVLHNKTPRKPNNKQLIIKLNNKNRPNPHAGICDNCRLLVNRDG